MKDKVVSVSLILLVEVFLLVAAIVCVANIAKADSFINSKLVVVDPIYMVNPFMPEKLARRMAQQIINEQRKYDKIRVRVAANRKVIADPFSQKRLDVNNTDAKILEEFYYWDRKFPGRKAGTVTAVLATPWTVGNKLDAAGWPVGGKARMGGAAYVGSVLWGGYCYANAVAVGYGGVNKFHQAKVVLKHELMHTYGAMHDETGPNIMNSAAQDTLIKSGGLSLPVFKKALEEIRLTLGAL